MKGLLVDFSLYVYEGIPVIYSKASYGDKPSALLYDPICLHQAFSSTRGHSSAPFINLQ